LRIGNKNVDYHTQMAQHEREILQKPYRKGSQNHNRE